MLRDKRAICCLLVPSGSDNDPYQCGTDQGKIMQEHLGGKLIVKPGEAHFNLEKGEQYKQFPFILKLIGKNEITK